MEDYESKSSFDTAMLSVKVSFEEYVPQLLKTDLKCIAVGDDDALDDGETGFFVKEWTQPRPEQQWTSGLTTLW